jgi:hypothetical protein
MFPFRNHNESSFCYRRRLPLLLGSIPRPAAGPVQQLLIKQMTDSVKCPEVHTRYRVQRLIRMGEWLEQNAAILVALFDSIDDSHTRAVSTEGDDTLLLETLVMEMDMPLKALIGVLVDLRRDHWNVKRGEDVTLYHRWAFDEEKRHEVVIKAPMPTNND